MAQQMKREVQIIESMVVSIIIFAIPVLMTCSLIYGWPWIFKYFLIVLSVIEFVLLYFSVLYKLEDEMF